MGFYFIPGLSKSDHYFSRNRPESKFGQFHNLTLDAMDHIRLGQTILYNIEF